MWSHAFGTWWDNKIEFNGTETSPSRNHDPVTDDHPQTYLEEPLFSFLLAVIIFLRKQQSHLNDEAHVVNIPDRKHSTTFKLKLQGERRKSSRVLFEKATLKEVFSPGRSLWWRRPHLRSRRTRYWEDTAHPPVTTPGRPAGEHKGTLALLSESWR